MKWCTINDNSFGRGIFKECRFQDLFERIAHDLSVKYIENMFECDTLVNENH